MMLTVNMKFYKIFMALLCLCSTSIFALPFNSNLPSEELERLSNGETLIRNIGKPKKMSIAGDTAAAKKLIEAVKDVDPNYLAEVIQIRKVDDFPDLDKQIYEALYNISDYTEIPYHSQHSGGDYMLYDSAYIINELNVSDTVKSIFADLYMEPFGTIHAPIILEKNNEYIFYSSSNNNNLIYKGFKCVGKHNMLSTIILFKDGENWILYGVGGVKAMKVSFLEERINTSFMNRIQTFCNYIFTKF